MRMLLGPNTEKSFLIPLAALVQVTTTNAGLVSTYCNNDPSAAPNWASAAGLFNQYRVVRYEAFLVPMFNVNAISDTPVGIRGVSPQATLSWIDEDDPFTTPAFIADGTRHADTMEVHSGYATVHRVAKPLYSESSDPDDTWKDTAAPLGTHSIKFVGNHSLLSTITHNLVIRWMVEFRGIGV